jgi:hypothetical protein
MVDISDDELLAELGVSVESKQTRTHSPSGERIIAGFEDILRFYEEHNRAPMHGEQRDIFERIYAVRLDRLRELQECHELLADLDRHGLLDASKAPAQAILDDLDDEELLAELGLEGRSEGDITELRHVQSREERRAAEEIANRDPCPDFEKFEPLFERVKSELAAKHREARRFGKDASISLAEFFILGGQIVYVAEVGDTIRAPNGDFDARLRVIYSNGTQSNLLRRSLQRALYKDDTGRRVTDSSAGPLFGDVAGDDEQENGTIYVLRSNSTHPYVAEHRELIHKIGYTSGSVETRISGAEHDATYLLSTVDVIAQYQLYGVSRRLEKLIHTIFSPALLDMTILDRFGKPVRPREWFLIPLSAIDEAVEKIRDGTITDYRYDTKQARFVRR